jgi:hypothetical protein
MPGANLMRFRKWLLADGMRRGVAVVRDKDKNRSDLLRMS